MLKNYVKVALRRQYENERRWRVIVEIASLFAFALACFGLVGLAALVNPAESLRTE